MGGLYTFAILLRWVLSTYGSREIEEPRVDIGYDRTANIMIVCFCFLLLGWGVFSTFVISFSVPFYYCIRPMPSTECFFFLFFMFVFDEQNKNPSSRGLSTIQCHSNHSSSIGTYKEKFRSIQSITSFKKRSYSSISLAQFPQSFYYSKIGHHEPCRIPL